MEPLDYLEALRRRWLLVVAALLVTGAAFWLTTPDRDETLRVSEYTASHTLLVDDDPSTRSDAQANLRSLAVLATSGDVPQRVIQRLGLAESPQALVDRVQIKADPKVHMLHISATGADPDAVAALVDAFADEVLRLASTRNEIQRIEAVARAEAAAEMQQTRVKDLEAQVAQLPVGSAEARMKAAERDALLNVYARQQGVLQSLSSQPPGPGLLSLGPAVPVATTVGDPSSTWMMGLAAHRGSRLFLGSVLGLLIGCGFAVLIDRVDSRVHSRRRAERAFGLPVVAEIPPGGSTPVQHSLVEREIAEAYRQLAFAVLHTPRWVLTPRAPGDEEEAGTRAARLVQGPSRLVVLTSPARGDVRTGIVANLAASLAAIGRDVIAVDADHEEPGLAEQLGAFSGISGGPGVRAAPELLATAVPGVRVATEAGLLGRDLAAGRSLIDHYLGLADMVLVSCPPVALGGEAASWAVEADAVLVVVSSGTTTAEDASVTTEHLARLQAQVLGVAFVTPEPHGAFLPALRRPRPTLPARRRIPAAVHEAREVEAGSSIGGGSGFDPSTTATGSSNIGAASPTITASSATAERQTPRPRVAGDPVRGPAATRSSGNGALPPPRVETSPTDSAFKAPKPQPRDHGEQRKAPPGPPHHAPPVQPQGIGGKPPPRATPQPDETETVPQVVVLVPETPPSAMNGRGPRRGGQPLPGVNPDHWSSARPRL